MEETLIQIAIAIISNNWSDTLARSTITDNRSGIIIHPAPLPPSLPIDPLHSPRYSNSSSTFAIRTHLGKFVSAEPGGKVVANRDQALAWETMSFFQLINGLVAIETQGHFLELKPDNTLTHNGPYFKTNPWPPNGNRIPWECAFRIEYPQASLQAKRNDDVKFALKAHNNKYVCAEGTNLVVNRDGIGPWELFSCIPIQVQLPPISNLPPVIPGGTGDPIQGPFRINVPRPGP